jgi:WD40 repeat protein
LLTIEGLSGSITAVAYSPTNSLVMAADEANNVKLWDEQTGQLKHTLVGHTGLITSVVFSPDGESAARSSRDTTVIIWHIKSQKIRNTLSGHNQAIDRVVFSSHGEYIAFSNIDGSVQLWGVSDESCRIYRLHRDSVQSVAFHPSKPLLAGASLDGNIHMLTASGDELPTSVAIGIGPLESIDFSPNKGHLVVGSQTGKIAIWDWESMRIASARTEHRGSVLDTKFSPTRI